MKKKKQLTLPTIPQKEDFTQEEKLELEREVLGIYLTQNPHSRNLELLRMIITCNLRDIEDEGDGSYVKVAGVIDSCKEIITKVSQKEMAFLKISDELSFSTEIIVFPSTYQKYKSLLQLNNLIILEGKIQNQENKFSLIAERILSPFYVDKM